MKLNNCSVHGTKSKTRSESNQMFILERKWSVNSCLLSLLTCLTFQEDLPLNPYHKLGVQAWNPITKEHPPHRNIISRIRLLVIPFLWPFSRAWKTLFSFQSMLSVYFPSTESERPDRASGSLSAGQRHSCKWQLAYYSYWRSRCGNRVVGHHKKKRILFPNKA